MANKMTALNEEINNKKEEIRRQNSHIFQLSKEKAEAVGKANTFARERDSAAAEYQKRENQIKAESQKKTDEYLSEAQQWKLQVIYKCTCTCTCIMYCSLCSLKLLEKILTLKEKQERKRPKLLML